MPRLVKGLNGMLAAWTFDDPALLRAIFRVHDREGYWWVECGTCDCGWQVPHYAA